MSVALEEAPALGEDAEEMDGGRVGDGRGATKT